MGKLESVGKSVGERNSVWNWRLTLGLGMLRGALLKLVRKVGYRIGSKGAERIVLQYQCGGNWSGTEN